MLSKKYILFILLILLVGCAPSSKSFYKKKHPTENTKSYSEKRGLMLLENTQMGRNKYMQSKNYNKTLKNSRKKYKR
jgi:hypothetical protein